MAAYSTILLKSLALNGCRTFSHRAATILPLGSSSTFRNNIPFKQPPSAQSKQSTSHYLNHTHYRTPTQHPFGTRAASSTTPTLVTDWKSGTSEITTTTTTPSVPPASALSTLDSDVKWIVPAADTVPIGESVTQITGAVIPFSHLTWLQYVVLPYTLGVMYYMDFLLNFMPWWVAIVTTTATIRLLFFPLVLKQNIVGIKYNNIMPEYQKIFVKLNEARCSGDQYKTSLYQTKLTLLQKEHGVSMWTRFWPIAVQAPAFMAVFFMLRQLCNVPVESLLTGGTLWFTNLTVPDPYYILPLVACGSTFATMEYGLEGTSGPLTGMNKISRWIMRCIPVFLFYIIYSFPAAILLFWSSTNAITLLYALLLRQRFAIQRFKIPLRIKHDSSALPLRNQSVKTTFRDAMDRGRSRQTTMDIRRLDDIAFKKAGIEPLRKTYKTPKSLDSSN